MARPITISIDTTKISKEHFRKGKYLDLAVFPNKNGADEWNNTHFVTQDVPKEAREQGVRGAICGNAKVPQEDAPQRRPAAPRQSAPAKSQEPDDIW